MKQRSYIAIDLKSFYASVECMDRGLDPLTTNLVVADKSRTEKTICLAVSPSLKAHGIPGRARLFEVVQKVDTVNALRKYSAPRHAFTGASYDDRLLKADPSLSLDYIAAPPRMARYMQVSTEIYDIYLKYIAPDDIHVYSIDEVFIDVTSYLASYKKTPRQLAITLMRDVLDSTGITATAGIGPNLFLAKVAMDIEAKHTAPDENGARIAELDEMSYRRSLWGHRPLTDFWRVGPGYAKKLESIGLYTMGDVARCSLGSPREYYNEDLLYKLFGINAELLIDHAWGYEPCTIADIKSYKPGSSSLGAGQVLQSPYSFDKARLIIREMADQLSLDLAEKGLVADQLMLTVGYDIENLTDPAISKAYTGEVSVDRYGRRIPKNAHGTINLPDYTCSTRQLTEAAMELFDRIMDPRLLVRRAYIAANHAVDEKTAREQQQARQLSVFDLCEADEATREDTLKKERSAQEAVLGIKRKYGKNAILKGMNLQEGATAASRNRQIGGHKA